MAKRGRPRKPLDMKLFEGEYRPVRDGPEDAAVRLPGTPEPTRKLKGEGLKLWKAVVPTLTQHRVATAADAPALTAMCEWWGLYRRHMTALEKLPAAQRGGLAEQRMTMLALSAWKAFSQAAATFGLNPSDRARLRISPEANAATPVPPRKRG